MIISVVRDVSYQFPVVSNDTQIVNFEPSKRLKMDELHQDKVTQTNVAKERKMVKIVTNSSDPSPAIFHANLNRPLGVRVPVN
jgi:hypothetical protein